MKLASFGFPGGRKEFCLEHKSADMVCFQCPCLIIPFIQAALCDQQCLQDGVYGNCVLRCLQVHVASKRCQVPGCTKRPSSGFLGEQAQFCAEHKSVDMVCYQHICLLVHVVQAALCDQQYLQLGVHCNSVLRCLQANVVTKRCLEPGCRKHPSFGFPGGKKQFCLEHKTTDMVCYGCPGLLIHFAQAALCDQQCVQGGVHYNSVPRCLQVDVNSKRCQEPGCKKRAFFGFPGGNKHFCLEHKSADMVCYWWSCLLIHFVQAALCDQQCLQDGVHRDFVPRCLQVDVHSKRCQEPGCRKHPSFGFPGGKKQFCFEHKTADMVCHPGVCIPGCTLAYWAVPIAGFAIDGFCALWARWTLSTRAVKLPDAHRTLVVAARAQAADMRQAQAGRHGKRGACKLLLSQCLHVR